MRSAPLLAYLLDTTQEGREERGGKLKKMTFCYGGRSPPISLPFSQIRGNQRSGAVERKGETRDSLLSAGVKLEHLAFFLPTNNWAEKHTFPQISFFLLGFIWGKLGPGLENEKISPFTNSTYTEKISRPFQLPPTAHSPIIAV